MSNFNKDDIIKSIYYDRGGFGSKSRTLAEAREKDKSVTMGDINTWFRANVEQKRKPVGQIVLSLLIPPLSIKWICSS